MVQSVMQHIGGDRLFLFLQVSEQFLAITSFEKNFGKVGQQSDSLTPCGGFAQPGGGGGGLS